MITIENDVLKVDITPKGAELDSIYGKQTGIEYLWQADPAFWPKKSPVLFPVVGGLKDNSYTYNGNTYQLTRHGFGRDSMYEVKDQTATSVRFELCSSEATLKLYPFQFLFWVGYTLKENELEVTFGVKNTGDETLYFSFGAHPAFNVPLVKGDAYTDYYLQFSETETAGHYPIAASGLIELEAQPLLENTNKLPLTKELFYKDALVFKELKSTAISILNTKNDHGLTVSYAGMPYMGIWSFKDADFVCIEPWCGLGDNTATTGELQEKEGINILEKDGSFTASWQVAVK